MDHLAEEGPAEPFSESELVEVLMSRDESGNEQPPFRIVTDELVGRHMVATRNLSPGEVIFVESPLTFGPSDNGRPVCPGCYRRIRRPPDGTVRPCSGCGYPVCGPECELAAEHADNECREFRRAGHVADGAGFDFDGGWMCTGGEEAAYNIISPLRAFLLRERSPDRWRLLWAHMSHDRKRAESTFWKERTHKVIKALESTLGLSDPSDVRTFEVILGVLLVNDFEVSPRFDLDPSDPPGANSDASDSQSIRALFALASMPSHSCVANATHDFSSRESGFRMTMRAVVPIRRGEDITHSYTEPLDPVLTRKSLLSMGKFFSCNCPRCADPSELGTHSSSVWCRGCRRGFLESEDAAQLEARWRCGVCGEGKDCQKVQEINAAAKSVAARLEPSPENPSGGGVEQHEKFIKTYSGKILHPNHVVLVDRKYSLAKLYGRTTGYEPDSLSDAQLERKMSLCREVLAVMDVIMPGRARKRGMMLYELHLPLVMLANRQLQRGPSAVADSGQKDTVKRYLKESLQCLRDSLSILRVEPEGSFEWRIVQGSEGALKQLEEWTDTVCNALK